MVLVMLIIPLPTEQQAAISETNRTLKSTHRIPLLLRNENSGWPLLQISLFSPADDGYTPVLGGGDCMFLSIPAFFFSKLFADAYKGGHYSTHQHSFTSGTDALYHLRDIKGGYSFEHKRLGIAVKETMGMYKSRMLHFTIGEHSVSDKLRLALSHNIDRLLGGEDATIQNFSLSRDNTYSLIYKEEQLLEACKPGETIFYQGQYFVDLGKLLNDCGLDGESIEYLQTIFKVVEFKKAKQASAGKARETVFTGSGAKKQELNTPAEENRHQSLS